MYAGKFYIYLLILNKHDFQVAISSRSKNFINTDCFKQVLDRIWYNKLSYTDMSFFWILKFTLSFLTLGLLAPCVMSYCPAETMVKAKLRENYQNDAHQVNFLRI
jgi:hypothetical protein